MNVIASMLNAFKHVKRRRDKNKMLGKLKLSCYQNVPYILTKEMDTNTL